MIKRGCRCADRCLARDGLAELRLGLARHKLLIGTDSLAEISAAVGYQSESAFSRAFQRRYGMRPGETRRHASDSAA